MIKTTLIEHPHRVVSIGDEDIGRVHIGRTGGRNPHGPTPVVPRRCETEGAQQACVRGDEHTDGGGRELHRNDIQKTAEVGNLWTVSDCDVDAEDSARPADNPRP